MASFHPNFKQYDSTSLPDGFSRIRSGKHGLHWAEFTKPIVKSEMDKREYRLIRLDNGMEIALVSDPEADQAAASVVVRRGSFHDPVELPGLAHLCEHLLFNGSRKYPAETEYETFITSNNGYTNASTGAEFSTYFFEISARNLAGALDRMAHIFLNPLFEASLVEREVKAVNSEFEGYKLKDGWRINAMVAYTSHPGHPKSRFTVGNIDTLWNKPKELGVDVRAALIKFYEENYSANLLRACIVGNQSLDNLMEMCSGLFSDLRNSNIPPSIFPADHYGPKQMLRQLTYRTIREVHTISLTFPLEDQRTAWVTEPAALIGMLIEHEVESSLLSYLKGKGWVNSISAGEGSGNTGYSTFDITLALTLAGKANYRDVVAAVFAFIKLMKLRGAREMERSWREYLVIAKNQFRWTEPGEASEVANTLASDLHDCSPKHLLVDQTAEQQWNEVSVQHLLDQLRPSAFYLTMGTQEQNIDLPEKEPYTGVEFSSIALSPVLLQMCNNPPYIKELDLPCVNPFIPYDLALAPNGPKEQLDPVILSRTPRIWHARDFTFGIPKATIWVDMRTRGGLKTARAILLAHLVTDVVDEVLRELSYQSSEAGMNYSLWPTSQGMTLQVCGYTSSILILLQSVVNGLKQADINNLDFARIKERLTRSLKNWHKSVSTALADEKLSMLLYENYYDHAEKEEALKTITREEVLDYGVKLLAEMFTESYIHGDLDSNAVTVLKETLSFGNTSVEDPPKIRRFILEPGTNALFQSRVENAEEVNGSVNLYYHVSVSKCRLEYVKLALLIDILQQPFFDELRTVQQLGYNVALYRSCSGETFGVHAVIQSETAPNLLDKAIEDYFFSKKDFLETLDDKTFDKHRQSVIDGFLETFKTMDEAASYNWGQIDSGHPIFDLYKKDAKLLETINKDDILTLFRAKLLENPLRAKVAVHMYSQRLQSAPTLELLAEEEIGLDEVSNEAFKEFLAGKPSMDALVEFVTSTFSGHPEQAKLLSFVDKNLRPFPQVAEGVQLVKSRAEFIKNLSLPCV